MRKSYIRLTEEQVHEICKLMKEGYTNAELASMYNLSTKAVSNIRCGKTHGDIVKKYELENKYAKKLTDEQVHEICKLLEEGKRNDEIAKELNISHAVVSAIRCGRSHTNISNKYNIKRITLTEHEIHKICKLLEEGYSNKQIAEMFNITRSHVSNIRNGNFHNEITKKYKIHILKVTEQMAHEICKLLEEGKSNSEIGRMYNLDPGSVSSIRCGKTYVEISKKYNIKKSDPFEHIDEECAHEICRLLEAGYKNIEVANICNVTPQVVGNIRCGSTHRDISKMYNIERIRRKRLISDDAIHEVCRLIDEGYKRKDISSLTNVSVTTIDKIKYASRYEDISSQYNFYKKRIDTKENNNVKKKINR